MWRSVGERWKQRDWDPEIKWRDSKESHFFTSLVLTDFKWWKFHSIIREPEMTRLRKPDWIKKRPNDSTISQFWSECDQVMYCSSLTNLPNTYYLNKFSYLLCHWENYIFLFSRNNTFMAFSKTVTTSFVCQLDSMTSSSFILITALYSC